MRKIAIVGAGQAGLQLALGLLDADYEVTLVSDRTADQIKNGRVMSTQCMFSDALDTERRLNLNFWEDETPPIEGIRYSVGAPDGQLQLQFVGRLSGFAQSVDQRLKVAGWLETFEQRGGTLIAAKADVEDLEGLAADHDLVVVAAGKGEIAALFEVDSTRSPFTEPQRSLAVAYVEGMEPLDPPSTFSICIVPGVGEYFVGPSLTLTGPCNTMCFEAIPGGPMDVFRDAAWREDLDAYVERCKEVLARFMPWEAERCEHIDITDDQATLAGAYAPLVRNAVGRLPSGAPVIGIADAIVLNDPLVGQGANNAAKCATLVLAQIREHGSEPFDEAWMKDTEDAYWAYAQYPTAFTNLMLSPPPHVADVMGAGAELPSLADRLAEGTNDPSTLFPWIADPREAQRVIAEYRDPERVGA